MATFIVRAARLAVFVWIAAEMQLTVRAEMPDLRLPQGAAPAPLWHDNFDEGWNESRRRGVPMIVFITSDHCVYCDAMKKDTWCNDSIMSQLRQNFVPIRLHKDRDSALLNRIVVPAYPTTLVASPEGKVLAHRVGYQPPDQMQRLFSESRPRRRQTLLR